LFEQVEDPGLDGDVESRQDFITQEHIGIDDECPGDGDTLTLSA
jgi:hypothetical protein